MKNTLFLICFLLSGPAFGQNQKFRFGISLTPGISGNFQSTDASIPKEVKQAFRDLEKTSFGYSGQIFTQYALNTRFKIQAGIGYTHTQYRTAITPLVFEMPEPGAPKYSRFEYNHEDLSIPLQARYNFKNQAGGFYVLGGFSPIYKLKRRRTNTLWYEGGTTKVKSFDDTSSTQYRDFNINGTLGIGYDLKLSKKLRCFVQPSFDCNLLGASKSVSLNRRIYALGLSVGLILG